jgi:dephospho-CoA kinase
MRKGGLTGAIGSGKSTVARIFSVLGIPVYHADEASKALLLHDDRLQQAVRRLFGDAVFSNGRPDTGKLADVVFRDEAALQRLNALLHPAVAADFLEWVKRQPDAPYVIEEAALLFEAGADRGLDFVIAVVAPEPLRRERTRHRYADRPEQFLLRQSNQWPEAKKAERADFILRNDQSDLLIPQVLDLHRRLTA